MGHQKKKNTFKSSDPDRPGTNFAFHFFFSAVRARHRFPCQSYTYLYISRQDGPLSLVIVKIVIPCCLHPSGDLLCKTNTHGTRQSDFLFFFRFPNCPVEFLFFFLIEIPFHFRRLV
jgi:hypothetical protein